MIRTWAVVMAAFFVTSIYADDLSVGAIRIAPNSNKQISIQLNNQSANYTAFQFDMILPDGVKVAGDASLNAGRKADHQLYAADLGNNRYRFLAYSMTNSVFSGTSGVLMNLTLTAGDVNGSTTKTCDICSQVFVEPDGSQYTMDDQSVSIEIASGESQTITISSAKQVPYCSDKNLDFTDKPDLKAYVATGYDKTKGTIWLTRVKQVPANTGFLLLGDPGDYEIPVVAGVSDVYYKNMFKGTISGTTIYTTDGDYTNYYLSNGTSGVGFYKVTKSEGQSIGANRCYLPIPTDIPANGSEGDAEVIKVSSALQVPYFTSKNLDFSTMDAQGVKAYTATGYNYKTGVIWLTRVKKVPAQTGVLVMAGEAGEYSVPTASVASVYENMFAGSETAQTIYTNETVDGIDYVNYYLSSGTSGIGFYKVTKEDGQSLGANRCYLQIPKRDSASCARGMSADVSSSFGKMILLDNDEDVIAIPVFGGMGGDDDDTTNIQSSMFNDQSSDVYYNLQGQRVENPGKGIFIRNGKKIIIR